MWNRFDFENMILHRKLKWTTETTDWKQIYYIYYTRTRYLPEQIYSR